MQRDWQVSLSKGQMVVSRTIYLGKLDAAPRFALADLLFWSSGFLSVVFCLEVLWTFWMKTIWLEPVMKPEDDHPAWRPGWQSRSATGLP